MSRDGRRRDEAGRAARTAERSEPGPEELEAAARALLRIAAEVLLATGELAVASPEWVDAHVVLGAAKRRNSR